MASLASNLNQALAEAGFLTPDSYIGNTAQDYAQAVAIAQAVALEAIEMEWQALKKTYSVTLTSATTYALPSDFLAFQPETAYQHGRWDRVDLPTTEATWALLSSVVGISSLPIRARIIGNQLNILNPQSGAVINIEYTSNSPITSSTGTAQTQFLADSDLWLLDDRMFQLEFMWRWKREKGLDWQSTLLEASNRRATVRGRDTANGTIVPNKVDVTGQPWTNLWVTN